ncbi:MAG: hypothetical protein ACD_8C00050G0005 [uncultured bacterium]|nr:MAG: hypothetical protein ACD_8C00050G0005 [uncultured bacterium]
MNSISKETEAVLKMIKQYGPMRSSEIVKMLGVSPKTVYKHLLILLDEQLIKKTGKIPRIFYVYNEAISDGVIISDEDDQVIENNYVYVSPSGEIRRGIDGFKTWCQKNAFDFSKEKKLLAEKIKAVQKIKKNGLVSAKKKILSATGNLNLNEVFFSDFYNLDHFGKTKLGQLVYLGKSSQNKEIIGEIATIIKPAILDLIEKYEIGMICFIPPTIDRKVQFLDVLKNRLKLKLPEIVAVKIPSATKVPQKTLRKLEDRIINAQKTIAVNPNQKITSNILIIDDATGSGATLNETAGKIRNILGHSTNVKIIGYSVVGSFKGFDVISEV